MFWIQIRSKVLRFTFTTDRLLVLTLISWKKTFIYRSNGTSGAVSGLNGIMLFLNNRVNGIRYANLRMGWIVVGEVVITACAVVITANLKI